MNTKAVSFVLALALATIACSMTDLLPAQKSGLGVPATVRLATLTPTFTASPTQTATPIPPTETATPTSTPTARVPMGEIVADSNVIIRTGPCYQTPIANAKPGSKFLVIGWFRSPHGEEWLRIEFRDGKGDIKAGWVRADLIDVTNSDLVPRAFENCPPTVTPTATKTTPPPHAPGDIYIRLYEHKNFGGDFLDINLTDCGIVNIGSDGAFNDSISSFELFAPANVEVVLTEHHYRGERFPGNTGRWGGNNGLLQVNASEIRALGLHDKISAVVWLVDGQVSERTYCQR